MEQAGSWGLPFFIYRNAGNEPFPGGTFSLSKNTATVKINIVQISYYHSRVTKALQPARGSVHQVFAEEYLEQGDRKGPHHPTQPPPPLQ
jgi:hypothetical protein